MATSILFSAAIALALVSNSDALPHALQPANGARALRDKIFAEAMTNTSLAMEVADSYFSFCWASSSVHPTVGIPQSCPTNQQKLGAFCYNNCPSGQHIVGLNCKDNTCASGYHEVAGVCWFSLQTSGKWSWESCPSDKTNHVGCCICNNANQESHGLSYIMTHGIPSNRGTPTCPSGQFEFIGLCYTQCPSGSHMVSAGICTAQCPSGWVPCGAAACASSTASCASSITTMITSAVQVGVFIGTLGTSGAADEAINAGKAGEQAAMDASKAVDDLEKAGKLEQFYQKAMKAKTAIQEQKNVKQVIDFSQEETTKAAKQAIQVYATTALLAYKNSKQQSPPSAMQVASEVLNYVSIADPTGISGLVNSFLKPGCGSITP